MNTEVKGPGAEAINDKCQGNGMKQEERAATGQDKGKVYTDYADYHTERIQEPISGGFLIQTLFLFIGMPVKVL